MDADIPIDIHTNKVIDWLISRRHVPKDWNGQVLKIREKINNAIKDMPVHEEIAKLLSGAYINYYHCKKIVIILKETESDSKNFFGHYTSQRMKDWLEIVKMYEKDNLFLVEAASLLLRNVNYEVPAFRKQIQKYKSQIDEFDKKEVDYEKQINVMKNEKNELFKQLGVSGKNIRKELLGKAEELPSLNNKLADQAKNLKNAVDIYLKIVEALSLAKNDTMAMLKYIMEKGDVTVYEWTHGIPPKSIEKVALNHIETDEENKEDVIDFGEIDDLTEDADNIDWGISAEDTEISGKDNEGVARGIEARSLLGHPETRALFSNNLLELEAFFKLRLHEIKNSDNSLSLSLVPDVLYSYDEKFLAAMLQTLGEIIKELYNSTSLHLLKINTNPKYVDQLAKQLSNKSQTLEKLIGSKEFVKKQREETLVELRNIQPKLQCVIDKTLELQEQIEKDISKIYNGREVNLMGGVNTL